MQRILLIFTLPFLILGLSGCVCALQPYAPETDVRLKIETTQPPRYSIRVGAEKAETHLVAADGRVNFVVPQFRDGCNWYLFGAVKVRDGSAENIRVIYLQRDWQTVRKWSLKQLAALPKNEAGYGVVKVDD